MTPYQADDDSRDDIIAIQASHGDHVWGIGGEQCRLLAQGSPCDVHKILYVGLVVEAAEAVLILDLQHSGGIS